MNETKPAFAERTIRCLKNINYRYMEDNGYKYIQKFTQFDTTLISRRNCLIDLVPRNVKNSDLLSILYSKTVREVRKPKCKFGNRVRISKYDLSFRRVISHSLQKLFWKLLQNIPKNLQHTEKRMNRMSSSAANFIRKSWSKSFNNGIAYNRVGLKCICAINYSQYTELF